MLTKRIATAVLLLPLVAWLLFAANIGWFTIGLSIIFTLAGWEWSRLMGLVHPAARFAYVIFLQLLMIVILRLVPGLELWPGAPMPLQLSHWFNIRYLPMAIILVGVLWWMINFICLLIGRHNWLQGDKLIGLRAIAGLVILLPSWIALISLRAVDILQLPLQGSWLLLFVLLQIWAADIGAFFTGKTLGKTPLAPKVSPKKTWEGVIGGLVLAMVVALTTAEYFGLEYLTILQLVLISLAITAFSIIGDLTESIYKRQQNLKDSSKLLPGHGGILDRIDSITSALPIFAAIYFWLL